MLQANTDANMPEEVWDFYYYGPYAYKYEFEESSFKEYTYLKTASTQSGETLYYECVFTYSYEGKEIERSYIGEPLTEEEMKEAYKTNPSNVNSFSFEIDFLIFIFVFSSFDSFDLYDIDTVKFFSFFTSVSIMKQYKRIINYNWIRTIFL